MVSIPSDADGCVDLDALRGRVGPDTAGLMLTNPNTVGLFDNNILEITRIVHRGGRPVLLRRRQPQRRHGHGARPGDMGFDVVHLNLHKTFATPHGGGGPGSGPVGCKEVSGALPARLLQLANGRQMRPSCQVRKVFYGNFLVVVKALAYMHDAGQARAFREAAAQCSAQCQLS